MSYFQYFIAIKWAKLHENILILLYFSALNISMFSALQLRRTADKLPRKEALRPVCIEPEMTISVQELLGNKEPLVRIEPTPVPPIIGKHDMNNAHKVVTS